MAPLVRAAGGVVWRLAESSDLQVLVVHRPKYDDWSFPKGKLDPGESDEQCAVREVEEETGLRCTLGHELAGTSYIDRKGRPKVVRYWEMTVCGGALAPNDEVDVARWLTVDEADGLLSYDRDRALLASFTEFAPRRLHPLTVPRSMLLRRTAADPKDWFTPDQLAESRTYQRPLRRLRMAESVMGSAVLLAFVAGDAAPRLLDGLDLDRGWALQLAVVTAGALTLVSVVHEHWFSAYAELVYDRRWGLSTQTVGGWLSDQVKNLLLGWVFLTIVLVPVYAAIRTTDLWWLYGWLIFMALQVVFAFLVPVVLLPLFNTFTPMEDGDLRGRIEAVADRAGVEVEGIYVMDASRRTRRDNAFVAGLGKTRRVVLYDTMLEYPPETIEHVVAHEIGHYRLHHIAKTIPLIGALTLAAFVFLKVLSGWDGLLEWAGVDDIGDPAAAPLFLLGFAVASKATSLVQSWHVRYKEREADLEALELLRDPDAMVELWRVMGPKNKADLDPGWWARLNHDHPELAERMAFARRWADLNTA